MRDYWLTQELLKLTGWSYVAICVIVLLVAVRLPKSGWGKAIAAAVVIGLASILPLQAKKEIDQSQVNADEFKVRYAKAKALFDERCKTAGEKIYKTVENVEGIQLLKVRKYSGGELSTDINATSQTYGDGFIQSFLVFEQDRGDSFRQLAFDRNSTKKPGYRYVVANDPKDNRPYRYSIDENLSLKRSEVIGALPRYALTFDEPVKPEERAYWIATSITKVLDLQTNEVLGEAIQFVIDPGQGSRAGQRTPWLFAQGCNSTTRYNPTSDRFFADQILKPIQGK
jgi:hypothetical protein